MELAFLHEVFPLNGKIHLFYLFGEKYYFLKKDLESSLISIFFLNGKQNKKENSKWRFEMFVDISKLC